MDWLCYFLLALAAFVLVFYFIFELHYFLRTCLSVVCARVRKKKVHILGQTRITGICLTTDIDYFLDHMNNARYIRELDFAKIDFFERTGLYQTIRNSGGSSYMGATTIRYRRFIKLFRKYVITTKIIYWDDRDIYMEHRFISPNDDNFVNAIVLCKVRVTDCNADEVIRKLAANCENKLPEDGKLDKPEMSLELRKWIEYNEISSASLRNATAPD